MVFFEKNGTQMGGRSGPSFLRMVGKDTMLLTDDVVSVLKAEGVVEKIPTSQKDLRKVQDFFNLWKQESGRSLSEISRITSFTANAQ
jgi:3-methyladenine DNA glycosylase Tag